MITNEIAVAEKLLHTGAVKLNPEEPFTWASGWKSPNLLRQPEGIIVSFYTRFYKK